MTEDHLYDENVAWPGYVDFLSTFMFILILFVAWSVNLLAGVEREQQIRSGLDKLSNDFRGAGFEPVIEGHKVRIPLKNKVSFEINSHVLDDSSRKHLRDAGMRIAANPQIRRIIVYGYADRTHAPDAFFNWRISVDRAMEVLQFLYTCADCGYHLEDIRPKLVLRGDGDLDARTLSRDESKTGDASDRRVDIILDQDETEK